ncbi:hypothetical protein MMC14_009664 [Varicellaria rhodocarpa]|nr:hypothetical protein [Varicellaria rhodocarpa]
MLLPCCVSKRPLLAFWKEYSVATRSARSWINEPKPVASIRCNHVQVLTKHSYETNTQWHARLDRPRQGVLWERYQYDPLPKEISVIRLVELLPGKDDELQCKIHHADLDNLPRSSIDPGQRLTYEALSYTWNSAVFRKSIRCDGKILSITQNLYDALRRLRQLDASRVFWIDAICINQSDVGERNHQVGLIRSIYMRASQVVPWLGEEDEHTGTAFDLVRKLSTNDEYLEVTLKADPSAIWDNHVMEDMGLPHFPSYEWLALAKLFERAYFQRIWIIQELVVSANAVVRCGSLTIRWENIESAARLLISTGLFRALVKTYGHSVRPSFVKTISNCRLSFHELQGGPGMTFSLLLCSTRRFQATDPRDKVIALMGLARNPNPTFPNSIEPDYSKKTAELYRDVTGRVITEEQNLSLISSVEDQSDRQKHELPSWVPDYGYCQRVSILGLSLRSVKFRAAGETKVSVKWTEGSSVIMINGFRQDKVDKVSDGSLDYIPNDRGLVLDWLDMTEPLILNKSLKIDAFWRTLIANNIAHAYPAPVEYQNHFESFLGFTDKRNQRYLKSLGLEKVASPNPANPSLFQAYMGYVAPRRKFFTTQNGLIGLGPRSIQSGDSVCILSGGLVPFILRKGNAGYRLVGESYIHGLMEGQAVQESTQFEEFLVH